MNYKNIEWLGENGKTWNPVTGCPNDCKWTAPDGKVVGCYARAISERFHHQADFSKPVFHEDRILQPDKWREPQRIFVCSMGDLFADCVPEDWIYIVLTVIERNPRHTFLLLTKNPKRLDGFTFPDNAWVGVSATHALMETECQRETPYLPRSWISFEPLTEDLCADIDKLLFDWVVIGALSAGARKYQPEREWVLNILKAAEGLPVFMKDNLDCDALGIERRQEIP